VELNEFREQIDAIDGELLRLFQERMGVSLKIAHYKKEHGLPVLDAAREQEKLTVICEKADVDYRPYVHELYIKIFELSRDYQESVIVLNDK